MSGMGKIFSPTSGKLSALIQGFHHPRVANARQPTKGFRLLIP